MSASKIEPQTPTLVVGEPCPCCGAKYRGPKMSEEERKQKRQAYNKKRREEMQELRKLRDRLEQEKLAQ